MTVLMVPALEGRKRDRWPTLGPQVIEWMEENLVFGPGDLRGEPLRLSGEQQALLCRIYEVYPKGHAMAGRRRFKRVGISLAKGLAKTEFAALIVAAELHPRAPVRTIGWDGRDPIGGPVTDPYIPMLAYTEEQSEELAYGALKSILEESEIAGDFDIGIERIMRADGTGKAAALATAPNARDGARTTFQVFDETHRFVLPAQKRAHQTMLANIPKRLKADAWTLEITTASEPGSGSIAEATMEYAQLVVRGKVTDSRLFFFHREASDQHDLETEAGARAAVIEASGPEAAEWRDIDGIVDIWNDPTTDRRYWERVWLNRRVAGASRAFEMTRWAELADPGREIAEADLITLGFDGSRFHDATAIVGTHVESGFQWLIACWERPAQLPKEEPWEVPQGEVDAAVEEAFRRWRVRRMYADPPYWQEVVAAWAGRWGEKVVVYWYTNRYRQMAYAVQAYVSAIAAGELSHDGSAVLTQHLGNAQRRDLSMVDEEGKPLYILQKERPDSPHKIDAGMAAILSWQARLDALKSGALAEPVRDGPGVWV